MLDTRITKKSDVYKLMKDHKWVLLSELSNVLADVMDVSTHVSAEISMSCSQIHIYSV